jgi:hypothetical protein
MRIEFTKDRKTILYGDVKAGQVMDIHKQEAEAFIKNNVAKKAKKAKEDK